MAVFAIDTFHPVALDSPDHLQPRGTMLDNSTNPAFNECLLRMFSYRPTVLDFGCAGGGMVRSLIADGILAIGLEGSDYNQINRLHEWPAIPYALFTVDLSQPFTLHDGSHVPYKFDVITMWEFVEHVFYARIDTMIENAKAHLKDGGLIIGSTNDLHSIYEGIAHHLTIQPISWWYAKFAEHGFRRLVDIEDYFRTNQAWVRKVKSNFVVRLEQ